MSDEVFSFVFDRRNARTVFPGVSVDGFLMAVLAKVPPAAEWDGCVVYVGATPLDPEATVCVVTRGPGADQAQLCLVAQLEALEVPVLALYEGGPEQLVQLARAAEGRWHVI